MEAPLVNPIRLRRDSVLNWNTSFPNPDKIMSGTEYFKGVNPAEYSHPWILGQSIFIQVFNAEISLIGKVITPTGVEIMSTQTITPTGWIGDDSYGFSYTFNQLGFHQIVIEDELGEDVSRISDNILVINPNNAENKIVNIIYDNSENDHDAIFVDGTTKKFVGKSYFDGHYMPMNSNLEQDIYKDNSLNQQLASVESTRKRALILDNIPIWYMDTLTAIMLCDNISINGDIAMICDSISPEPKENSELMKVTIELSAKNNKLTV